ncbi:hypothetical protein BHE74_00009102 [Ensete ventricosum]|nr:hypothetical protein BHE74_00009102 [Ensete ventricosum]RZR87978.1 hypothetical protein BHM03_00015457 [Ensete ventricosum]
MSYRWRFPDFDFQVELQIPQIHDAVLALISLRSIVLLSWQMILTVSHAICTLALDFFLCLVFF